MSATYEACRLLLEDVWYAKQFLTGTNINFSAIEDAADKIVPSDSEIFRVELARHLWTGSGRVSLLGFWTLDKHNRSRAINALRVFSGDINFLEPKPLVEQISDYLDTR